MQELTNNDVLVRAIWESCNHEPRDFSLEEQQLIRSDSSLRDELLAWFETTLSDGYWSCANIEFLHGISPKPIWEQDLNELVAKRV